MPLTPLKKSGTGFALNELESLSASSCFAFLADSTRWVATSPLKSLINLNGVQTVEEIVLLTLLTLLQLVLQASGFDRLHVLDIFFPSLLEVEKDGDLGVVRVREANERDFREDRVEADELGQGRARNFLENSTSSGVWGGFESDARDALDFCADLRWKGLKVVAVADFFVTLGTPKSPWELITEEETGRALKLFL